jgi:hypothetical protein
MADIGHSAHSLVDDLYHNLLASIQIALSFIGVKLDEADQIDVEEQDTMDDGADFWTDKRVPEGGVDALKTVERGVHPFEVFTSEGCDALRVCEGAIDKEVDRLLAWHATSSSSTRQGISACWGR